MVRDRTVASIKGMIAGILLVTGLGLAAGIELFPSLSMSLVGMAVGGWLAERQHEKRETTGNQTGTETV